MISAAQKDDLLLEDIKSASSTSDFFLWWLGQSGFLIKWKDKYLLFDPYLSDSLTYKYAKTDKPHIRMTELVLRPEKLDMIDVVSSSHNHTDHLDGETLIPLMDRNPNMKFIIPEANRDFVVRRVKCGTDFPLGIDAGEKFTVGPFQFTGIPAAHNELERDEAGRCKFLGYVVEFGPWCIYHSGDTLWRQEIVEALRPFSIDLMILPINGNKPERRVAGNLDAKEALKLTKMMNARAVIPCHYHMFTFNTVDPDEFIKEASHIKQKYFVLRAGERWSSSQLTS